MPNSHDAFTRRFRTVPCGLVPGVGHMLHYAVPEEVAEAIEEAGGLATMRDKTRHASYTASAA